MKSMKSLRTAVIGVGNMGKNHARVYNGISTLCAVADPDRPLGENVAKTYHARYYDSYITLLDREKPDAVSVVVPTALHKTVVDECLKRKIPTLVEKPIASTLPDAKKMLASAKKSNTFLMVGHIERFNPAVIQLKQFIKEDKIGKLFSLLTIRVGISPPKAPHANVVMDLGIHDVDICNYLLEEFPIRKVIEKQKIFKNSDVDSASVHLTYTGCNAVIMTNWVTPIKIRRLYATGMKGFIELDFLSQKITFYSEIINTVPDGNFIEFISLLKTPKKELFISKKEPLKEELTYFLKKSSQGFDSTSLSASIEALRIVI
jgi:UDP-N-acetylglucosamine 3-dehydrogenase